MTDLVGSLMDIDEMDDVLEGTLLDASSVPGFVEEVRDRPERMATLTE